MCDISEFLMRPSQAHRRDSQPGIRRQLGIRVFEARDDDTIVEHD